MRAVPQPKMDESILNAIHRLKKDADFQKLIAHLEELKIARFRVAAMTSENAQSRWQAGRGQELDELLDAIEQCDETLKNMKGFFKKS